MSGIFTVFLSLGLPLLFLRNDLTLQMDAIQLIYLLGKFFGFSAFIIFFLQYLWTAKFHFLENALPYDQRVAAHRSLGFSGFLLLTLHPLFILLSYNLWGSSLIFSTAIFLGFAAFFMLLIIIGSTFLGRIWQVKYESWKKIHYVTFVVLTLAFIHSLRIGSDLFGVNRYLWTAIWLIHAALVAGKLVIKIRTWIPSYKVLEVIENDSSTNTLVIEKPKRDWQAGQFGFLSLKRKGKWEGWHPFSITTLPSEGRLSMTIKPLGDFTSTISETQAGEPVKLNPGFGGFVWRRHRDSMYTMIAGGVGVTPIYSVLKEMAGSENPPPVRLFYSVHHESEILFRDELDSWFSTRTNWNLTYVVTSQPDWSGVTGRLTPERAAELCAGNFSGTYFLCGPAPMIKALRVSLRQRGVPRSKIVNELFVFLP